MILPKPSRRAELGTWGEGGEHLPTTLADIVVLLLPTLTVTLGYHSGRSVMDGWVVCVWVGARLVQPRSGLLTECALQQLRKPSNYWLQQLRQSVVMRPSCDGCWASRLGRGVMLSFSGVTAGG